MLEILGKYKFAKIGLVFFITFDVVAILLLILFGRTTDVPSVSESVSIPITETQQVVTDPAPLEEAEIVSIEEIDETGTSFQLDGITFSTNNTVRLHVPHASVGFVEFGIYPVAETSSPDVDLTIGNLKPSTTYYTYLDTATNYVEYVADGSGNLLIPMDLTTVHSMLVQEFHSTYDITAVGGDCDTIGTWNLGTLTCTLDAASTVAQTILISGIGVTLDGNKASGAKIDIRDQVGEIYGVRTTASGATIQDLDILVGDENTQGIRIDADNLIVQRVSIDWQISVDASTAYSFYAYVPTTGTRTNIQILDSDVTYSGTGNRRGYGTYFLNTESVVVDNFTFVRNSTNALSTVGLVFRGGENVEVLDSTFNGPGLAIATYGLLVEDYGVNRPTDIRSLRNTYAGLSIAERWEDTRGSSTTDAIITTSQRGMFFQNNSVDPGTSQRMVVSGPNITMGPGGTRAIQISGQLDNNQWPESIDGATIYGGWTGGSGASVGIYLLGNATYTTQDISITNNEISNFAWVGISANNGTVTVGGNTIRNNQSYDIYCEVDDTTCIDAGNNICTQSRVFPVDVVECVQFLSSVASDDTDPNGNVETLVATFREDVAAGTVAANGSDFTVTSCDTGSATRTVTAASVTDTDEVTLTVTEDTGGSPTGDTGVSCTVTVTTGTDGNTISDTAANFVIDDSVTTTDSASPVVMSVSPLDEATLVNRLLDLVITFSEPMVTDFVSGVEYSISPVITGLLSTWSDNDTVVTITHDQFSSEELQTITTTHTQIHSAASEQLDVTGPESGDWTFTTSTVGAAGGSSLPYSPPAPVVSTTPTIDIEIMSLELVATQPVDINWIVGGLGIDNVDLYYGDANKKTRKMTLIEGNIDADLGVLSWAPPAENLEGQIIRIVAHDSGRGELAEADSEMFSITTEVPIPVPDLPPGEIVIDPEDTEEGISPITGELEPISGVFPGMFIRSPGYNVVYFVTQDTARRPFLEAVTYFTHADTWSQVTWVTDATLPTLTLITRMLPKAGIVLIKVNTDVRVYLIESTPDGDTIRWIKRENIARQMYGRNWADYVIDVDPVVLGSYLRGLDVSSAEASDTSIMKTRQEIFEAISAGI